MLCVITAEPLYMGPFRWTSDGASIFSVDDGKRLAQTPVKEPTRFERIRADRIARQQLETPLVRGVRLLPVFTPGRCALYAVGVILTCLPPTCLRVPCQK